jgi:hypothetical protein
MNPTSLARWMGIGALLCVSLARAQISLPPLPLPKLPLPIDPVRTVNNTLEATRVEERLRELRKLRIDTLLRINRTVLEADPRGSPIVRSQLVALDPTVAALARARAAGFEIVRTTTLDALEARVVVLLAPRGMATRRALRDLRDGDPGGIYDFNHLYFESGQMDSGVPAVGEFKVAQAPASPLAAPVGMVRAKLGLIDGGIDRSHAAFGELPVHEYGCDTSQPTVHGTAVASLLVGRAGTFHGAAPGGELYAADVYCGAPSGGAVDAVAAAFGWMAREHVAVINISLVGPANVMLEQVIKLMTARGHLVVAAVGTDGPSAPPLFPAAYPEVIAVTAVDGRQHVLLEACRGKHVDFAAPGANMEAASLAHAYAQVRGTSFAAPIVAGLLATRLQMPNRTQADAAVASLRGSAVDLGSRGPDKIFGSGLVGEDVRVSAVTGQ